MPLYFVEVCDFLDALEKISRHDPPYIPARSHQEYKDTIQSWFTSYKISLYSTRVDPIVLLSALYPAKRADRVYNIQAKGLTRKLRHCLQLGLNRWPELGKWNLPGYGDLSDCVERVLKQAEFPKQLACKQVTLQQIDDALASIASRCRFSGVKARLSSSEDDAKVRDILRGIYQKLQSREAKWLTRLILKDFSCIDLDKYRDIIYSRVDPRLPVAMRMYDSFESAITALKAPLTLQLSETGQGTSSQPCLDDVSHLVPQIGIKVGSPAWAKARGGIRHALSMVNGRTMSLERKYDGEYCQIHVDLSRGDNCVQIFSKSGKDSTEDRKGVVSSIKSGLRLWRNDCSFRKNCVLEGELLIWDDKRKTISDFHKIRKHVARSGVFLGTGQDSQSAAPSPKTCFKVPVLIFNRPHDHERLMMVFYDVLLVDEYIALHRSYSQRRWLLEQILTPIQGRTSLSQREEICFSQSGAPQLLKQALANAFSLRWEGIVLKPSDEPYFSPRGKEQGHSSRWIKLKKDCISGLGDTADFAVVGAGYDAKRASQLGLPNILWTHFFLGCLTNKHAALYLQAKPEYLIIDCVTDCIQKDDFKTLNQQGKFLAIDVQEKEAAEILRLDFASINPKLPRLQTVFRQPFVFDVAGSGFEKAPDRSIFTLRFPRVMKVCWDRDWADCVDLYELQEMAEVARNLPGNDLQREIAEWIQRLDDTDRRSSGKSRSWDSSDEEESRQYKEQHFKNSTEAVFERWNHSSLTGNALSSVRMDTPELQADEKRLSNGEVTGQATSIGSSASSAFLHNTSIAKYSNSRVEVPGLSQYKSLTQGKRNSGPVRDMSPGMAKRRKTSQAGIAPVSCTRKRNSRSLQEITGDARPALNGGVPAAPLHRPRLSSPQDLELAQKVSIGAHKHAHGRRRKPAKCVDLSSLAKETIADECSSRATTQQIAMQHPMSSPIASASKTEAKADSLLTLLNMEEAVSQLEMSLFQDCIILQGSSVEPKFTAGKSGPVRPDITLLPLDDSLGTLDYVLQEPTTANKTSIILLINTESAEAACNDLIVAVNQLIVRQYESLTVFDAKVLSLLTKGVTPRCKLQDALWELLCAKITLNGSYNLEEGTIRVEWRSGELDTVNTKNVEAIQRVARS